MLTTIPPEIALGSGSGPQGIATGPNGTVWVADTLSGQIQSINTNGTVNPPINVGGAPERLVYVPGGDIWYTNPGTNAIGWVNPSNPADHGEYATPNTGSQPAGITYDPTNGLIYFTEAAVGNNGSQGRIGYFNPATIQSSSGITDGAGNRVPTLGGLQPKPIDLTYDAARNKVWFLEQGTDAIGSFDPTTQTASQTLHSRSASGNSNATPTSIALGSDGNLWYTVYHTGQVDMFNPSTSTFAAHGPYSLPSSANNPNAPTESITAGPDGNMYVAALGVGQILWFNPSALASASNSNQVMGHLNTPNNSSDPFGITAGPDGNVWFTEYGADAVGEAVLPTQLTIATPPPTSVTANSQFGLTVEVTYADTGAVDAAFNGPITVSLAGGGSPGGTTTMTATNGKAVFTDLTFGAAGTYSLVVSGDGTSQGAGSVAVTSGNPGGGNPGGGNPGGGNPGGGNPGGGNPGGNQPGNTSSQAPTIIAERITSTYLRHNRKGKGIGKQVEEIVLTFGAAMSGATIGNAGNYQVSWASTRKVRRKLVTTQHPVAVLSATPDSSDTTVTLVTSAAKSKFAKGGQLAVTAGSILGANGTSLAAPMTFTIAPRARGISASS